MTTEDKRFLKKYDGYFPQDELKKDIIKIRKALNSGKTTQANIFKT